MESAPNEILTKYPRKFVFKDGKNILAQGQAVDVILVHHDDAPREYWKGVEMLKFNDGRQEFRFMYWARKKQQSTWRWGRFNVCLKPEHLAEIIKQMKAKGWIA